MLSGKRRLKSCKRKSCTHNYTSLQALLRMARANGDSPLTSVLRSFFFRGCQNRLTGRMPRCLDFKYCVLELHMQHLKEQIIEERAYLAR